MIEMHSHGSSEEILARSNYGSSTHSKEAQASSSAPADTPVVQQGSQSVPDDAERDEEVNRLQRQLGGYGRYQWFIYVMLGLVYMRGGWHVWIPTLQNYDPGHHCTPAPGLSLNQSIPGHEQDGTWVWDSCKQYVNLSISNATETCTRGWTYDWGNTSATSVVSKLDMVCDDKYQVTLTSTMYMVGTTCGAVFLTPLSDRLGTKWVMLVCLWLQAIVGTCLIWAADIVVFCMLNFFIGICNMAIALCAYVLMTETFDAEHRELPTISLQYFWATSIMTLALFGYLLPRWEDLELLVSLSINVLTISYIWLIPESLPWLLSKGKMVRARAVIQRFLTINRLPDILDLDKVFSKFTKTENGGSTGFSSSINSLPSGEGALQTKQDSQRLYTYLDLFKTRRLRYYSLLMFYLFLVNALAYIGIMYVTPTLNGDRFLNLFLLGVVEIPAYMMCYAANRIIGRRKAISIFLLICAVANITILFVPDHADSGADLTPLQTTLFLIGKFGITGSYSTIYLYASEVFPTVIRNQAVGASSFFENIGSVVAPSMVLVNDEVNNLPLAIFGGMAIVGSGLVLLLPETHNRPMPQTVEDVERDQGKGPFKQNG